MDVKITKEMTMNPDELLVNINKYFENKKVEE